MSPAARVELLDRLLEENLRKAAHQPQKRMPDASGVDSAEDDGLLFT